MISSTQVIFTEFITPISPFISPQIAPFSVVDLPGAFIYVLAYVRRTVACGNGVVCIGHIAIIPVYISIFGNIYVIKLGHLWHSSE